MASPKKKAQCVLGYVMFFWGYVKDVVYGTKVHNVVYRTKVHNVVYRTKVHHVVYRTKVHNVVYRTKVHNVVELTPRIQAAIKSVDQGLLQRSWMELEYRLDVILNTKGSHGELD
ncbi:hypothetical protein AVEN_196590-1 [Araneus ventricosus]|uniref:Uncharacterized protein n=1 Tax=Araneus ventricosus TaxID=182803 RepID=A0A4Y2SUY7_ARAVE|nr:hypothetical protein AVEN_196590-1 [Araneus ventricosus]